MIINTYYNDYTLYFWYSSLSRYNCIFFKYVTVCCHEDCWL